MSSDREWGRGHFRCTGRIPKKDKGQLCKDPGRHCPRTAQQVFGGGSGLRPEDRCGESSVTNRRCQGRPWGLAVGAFDTEHGCECGFHPRLLQEATEVCSAVTASPSICRKQHVGCRELCGLD